MVDQPSLFDPPGNGEVAATFDATAQHPQSAPHLRLLRNHDPVTSRKAAAKVADPDRLNRLQREVLANLVDAGDEGLSDWHHPLRRADGSIVVDGRGDVIYRQNSTAGKRRGELEGAGLVVRTEREVLNQYGNLVMVSVVTAAGVEALYNFGAAVVGKPA